MKKYNGVLYILAALKFILPFVLQNSVYEPHRDEFLYLIEAQHMAWGYMEVPPLLSGLAWITQFLGHGIFWIKFWPAIFGAFTYLLSGKIIISLGGKLYALVTAFFCFIFSGYLRVHFLFQPNFPEIFFYTLIAFAIIKYIQTNKNSWLYITGIAAGLGMLSKYSVIFFIVAVVAALLLTPQRKIFLNRHFYFATGIGILIFLPNAIWQATHHFPVVYHMNELQQTQLQYISPVTFLIEQLLMFAPVFFIWLMGLWFVAFNKNGKPYRFIAWAYVFVIAILLVLHGKSYYSLGLYPPLIAFGSYQLERVTAMRFRALRYITTAFTIILGLWLIPVLLPFMPPKQLANFYSKTGVEKTGALQWEDGKNHALPQDFADMLSWKGITEKSVKAYNLLTDEEKKHTLFFCDNYGQAGAVNFYGSLYHLPEAYSSNASFLYWLPANLHVDNLLLVTDDEEEMQRPFIKMFASAQLVDSVSNPYAREHGSLIILLKGGNEEFNKFFIEKIEKDKAMLLAGKREPGN